jgi:predicted Zn-dependent protease
VVQYLNQNKMADRVAGYKWEFNAVNNKEANAWCMPGGKIVVYTGLLPITQDEASLAFGMGHEIGHAIARHGNERMSQMLLAQTGGMALDVALQNKKR